MRVMAGLRTWDIWYPKAAATGMPFARGRCEPTERMLVHSPAEFLTVEVFDDERRLIARGQDLERTQPSPMCVLRLEADRIVREDVWPTDADVGTPVLLPGGEVGILQTWWNSDDRKEWRWSAEFYNSIR